MGRYAYSIWPVVSFLPWFKRFDGDRVIISMINRLMANHSCLKSHLGLGIGIGIGIGIVKSPMCVCSLYESCSIMYCEVARDLTSKGRKFG
jgi:hypothetical protein